VALRFLSDLAGTFSSYFRIGKTGPRLKNNAGALNVRDTGDTADAALTAAAGTFSGAVTATVLNLTASAGTITLNSGAAGSGANWTYILQRPTTGMTASVTLTLPIDDGTAGQILQTDGAGVLSWVSAGSTAASLTVDTTSVVFGSSTPVTMFTLPVNAVVEIVRVYVDTAFNATGPANLTIGLAGNTAKYMGAGEVDLTAVAVYEVVPSLVAVGSTEALIVTFSAGTGASAGAARVEVFYTVPQ